MALDTRLVLAGNIPDGAQTVKGAIDTFREAKAVPFRQQLLEDRAALSQQALAQAPFKQQILEQDVATGEREADLAEQTQMLIATQRGINSFEAGDMGGVEQAIMETTPPSRAGSRASRVQS